MASDNLNQVGRYIGKTGKTADRALKRPFPIQPRLERIRDVFDSTTSFEMDFVKTDQDKRVLLDLFFNLPPPIRGCKAGCIVTKCEEFDFASGGDHAVTLTNGYLVGSVSVFINGDKLSQSSINELSPTAGEVFFQGTDGPDTVVICYIYSECAAEPTFPLCPALSPSFEGATILFSDRFDRTPSIIPYGGKGYWYNNFNSDPNILPTPIELTLAGGVVSFNTLRYIFENAVSSGIISEQLLSVDLSNFGLTSSSSLSINADSSANSLFEGSSNVFIDGTGGVFISRVTGFNRHHFNTFTSQIDVSRSGSVETQTFHYSGDLRQKLFIRAFFDGFTSRAKIWPQDQPEPTEWFEFNIPLPSADQLVTRNIISAGDTITDMEWEPADFVGGNIVGTAQPYLMAIQHWGSIVGGVAGAWNALGEPDNSWSKLFWKSNADLTDNTYFGANLGPDDIITNSEFGTGTINYVQESLPTTYYGYTSGFFDGDPDTGGNPAVVNTIYKESRSFTTTTGKVSSMRINGEISWDVPNTFAKPGQMTILFKAYHYDTDEPDLDLDGTIVGQYTVFRDTWAPFSVDIPQSPGHKIQWGISFLDDPTLVGDSLVAINAGSFLRTTEVTTSLRAVYIEATTDNLGGALPFCPDTGPLSDRCQQIFDNPTGPTYDFRCDYPPEIPNAWISTNNVPWTITNYDAGSKLELNNSIKVSFKAAGNTEDGSDGRCAWPDVAFGWFKNNRAVSAALFSAEAPSPAACGNFALSLQFKFGVVGPSYNIDSFDPDWGPNSDTFYPSTLLRFGTNHTNVHISSTNDPIGQFIQCPQILGSESIDSFLSPNTTYSAYMEFVDGIIGIKIWNSNDTQPIDWLIRGAFSSPYSLADHIYASVLYRDYIDDNFSAEIFNISMTSLTAVL